MPRMQKKRISMLRHFYIAQRYNALYYLSEALGALAVGFAWLSVNLVHVAPWLSDVAEWRSRELIAWGFAIHQHNVKYTLYATHKDIE